MRQYNTIKEELSGDFSSPAYIRIADFLTEKIHSGALEHGKSLPTEPKLAEMLSCGRVTLRHALEILEKKELIIRRRGRYGGNFVNFCESQDTVKKKNVGFVSNLNHPESEPYFQHIFAGIQKGLEHKAKLHFIEKSNIGLLNVFNDSSLDGLLLTGCNCDDHEIYDFLINRKMPHVIIHSSFDFFTEKGIVFCDTDNLAGGTEAVEHLINLGHHRIAYIGGSNDRSNSADRLQAYLQTMTSNGIKIDNQLVHSIKTMLSNGYAYNVTKELLSLPELPTAIFVAGFSMALETIQAIKDAGLKVPEDISIVGFDDFEIGKYISPALTTVRQPLKKLGEEAAKKLWENIVSGKVKKKQLILPTKLIVRESTSRLK